VIRRWIDRRLQQHACPHPRAAERSWLIDTGMRKLLECGDCGKRRVV
jgi:hypothetical protein